MLCRLVFVTFLLLTSCIIIAQTAIRGVIYDKNTGEAIPFADVVVQGTTNGATSDLDGAYHIPIKAGSYNLVFNYLGYSDLIVENVTINEGKIEILDVKMSEDTEQLTEVVVTGQSRQEYRGRVDDSPKKIYQFY